jgi:CRP-like cAMP-binding protein
MQPADSLYNDAYEALKSSKLFENLDDSLIKEALSKLTPITWQKNEMIDYEICTKECFFIVTGRLKITQVDPISGRTIAPFLLSRGDIFDIFSLLDGQEHEVFPVAIDDVTALSMPIDEAREFICKHPEFNKNFLPYLGEMMRQLESFGSSLVFHDTATRLANLILKHSFTHKNGKCKIELINNLSHESLAELIGTVRTVITTQLQKLKDENIISHKRGEISIENLEKLINKLNFLQAK